VETLVSDLRYMQCMSDVSLSLVQALFLIGGRGDLDCSNEQRQSKVTISGTGTISSVQNAFRL